MVVGCPHTCNPEVAKAQGLDRDKGIQCGIQVNKKTQAGGRCEVQQLMDSFRMGEKLPKVVIGNEGVRDNLPSIIVCEKIQKPFPTTCPCDEPNLDDLPPCIRETVESELTYKRTRAMDCLLYKARRLHSQVETAREINTKLNQQMVNLIKQQASCPYTCDKPVRMSPPQSSCPPSPCPPPRSPCPPPRSPCPALKQQSCPPPPCPPPAQQPCPGKSTNRLVCPPKCPNQKKTSTNNLGSEEINSFLERLEKMLHEHNIRERGVCNNPCDNTPCPCSGGQSPPDMNLGSKVNDMLNSCKGNCNKLRAELECPGTCNPSVTLECSGPCSGKGKRGSCDGPCNIEGLKNKIASLSQVPELCDKMKSILSDCYFAKDDSPLIRYNSLSFKQKYNNTGNQSCSCSPDNFQNSKQECPASQTLQNNCPPCNPPRYTSHRECPASKSSNLRPQSQSSCPGGRRSSNGKSGDVLGQINEIEATLVHLSAELENAYKENDQLVAQRMLLNCVKTSPCEVKGPGGGPGLPSCPALQPCPPCPTCPPPSGCVCSKSETAGPSQAPVCIPVCPPPPPCPRPIPKPCPSAAVTEYINKLPKDTCSCRK